MLQGKPLSPELGTEHRKPRVPTITSPNLILTELTTDIVLQSEEVEEAMQLLGRGRVFKTTQEQREAVARMVTSYEDQLSWAIKDKDSVVGLCGFTKFYPAVDRETGGKISRTREAEFFYSLSRENQGRG